MVYESTFARADKVNKRLVFIIILLIIALIGTNLAWICYENSFEDVEITQENDDGYNNYVGNDGDIYNGNAENKNP